MSLVTIKYSLRERKRIALGTRDLPKGSGFELGVLALSSLQGSQGSGLPEVDTGEALPWRGPVLCGALPPFPVLSLESQKRLKSAFKGPQRPSGPHGVLALGLLPALRLAHWRPVIHPRVLQPLLALLRPVLACQGEDSRWSACQVAPPALDLKAILKKGLKSKDY